MHEQRLAAQRAATAAAGNGGRGILAIDFDDVITADGEAAVTAMAALRAIGWGLVIHTSNADHVGVAAWVAARWPPEAGDLPPVTDVKPQATAYIDDKAYRFIDWPSVLRDFG